MKLHRKQLQEMIIKEMSVPSSSSNSDLNRQIGIEMLKKVIRDLQTVPEQNLDRYIQYLITHQIPNIISTLED